MVTSILVAFRNYPGRCIRDALFKFVNDKSTIFDNRTHKIKNLALDDEIMKGVHNFFHRSIIIPPMQVEQINIIRS